LKLVNISRNFYPRCTWVENAGEGIPEVLPKSLVGSRLSGKNARGGPPILGFIAFLLTSVLKFDCRGYYIYPPPPPSPRVHL